MNRLLHFFEALLKRQMAFIAVIMTVSGISVQAQSLACNDAIQVSLDENCVFSLNLDMLLEAPPMDTTCLIIEVYDESGQVIPGAMFTAADRDKTYDYAVLDTCRDNSCWGTVLVEDKLPPQFDCEPYDTVWCSDTKYVLPQDVVDEACGSYDRVIVSDVQMDLPCDSACAGKRYITYYYVDESGNRSEECVKEVCYRRATLADIDIPADVTFNCINFVDANPVRTGVPSVDGYPIYPNAQFCEVNCDYTDQVIDVCPGTQKILRKWTCYDWCMPTGPDNPMITWQVIKVLDEDGPVVYCPTTDDYRDTIGTNPWSCTGNTVLPEPHLLVPGQTIVDSSAVYIISECSEVDYSVRHVAAIDPADCTPDPNAVPNQDHVRYNPTTGRWEAFDLPLGCNWFYYTFVDECGNSSECTFDIYVEDDVPPIAVCDEHTVVTLIQGGTARAFALTFDDGSIDNCGVDSIDVRRMDSPCTNPTTSYGPYVDFCCEDINTTVMVEFRVFDAAGNFNICMVEVEVNDKEPPVLYPPPNITVDCRYVYDTSDLDKFFGKVVIDEAWRKPIIVKDDNYAPDFLVGLDGYATDNCDDVVIEMEPRYDLICGVGTITRTWTATDPQGLFDTGIQIISIEDRDPFGHDDIKWPQDVTMTGCVGIDTDTTKTGAPGYSNVDCANIAATYKDLVYNQVPDACYKIERKWTVVDWCAFDMGNQVWQWNYTQIIKVTDLEDPFFVSCKDTTICDEGAYLDNGQCMGAVRLEPGVSDKCTPTDQLVLMYRIDPFDSGTYGPWTPGRFVEGDFPVGSHRIQWEVEDGCGNSARCDYIFEVKDCKAPTPYCRSGVITVLMEGVGTIDVWASDLDIGSFDNCTDTSNLIFSFDSLGKETSRTYTCDSMQGQFKIRKKVRMYVTDECGNVDYCETIIELQDNQKCVGSLLRLSGDVRTEDGRGVEDVEVYALDPGTRQIVYTTYTDDDGYYEFDRVVGGKGYVIQPKLNEDHLNGVSTRDITMIQRDLLGLTPLASAYKVFAADANYRQDVTASDISEIRKLILGRKDEFTNNESWRFLKSDFAMSDIREPWNCPQERELPFVDSNVDDLNFVAVKTGDVDGDVETLDESTTRSSEEYRLTYDVYQLEDGLFEIRFFGDRESGLTSFQGTFEFGGPVDVEDVFGGTCAISAEQLGTQWQSAGQVSIAWSSAESISVDDEEMFSLLVRTDQLGEIRLSDAVTRCVAYDQYLDDRILKVRSKRELNSGDFILMQNIPNPFSGQTTIGFELPENQDFVLSFYAANGEMLKVIEGYGRKGFNEIQVSQSDFPAHSGTVVFYQLDTENESATRKLIMIR